MAVAVMRKDHLLWSKGYGFADVNNKTKVDPSSHMFRIGSISKTLTALALGRMKSRGEINIDLPIGTYLPNLPDDKKQITLRQLGGHLAGIRHYRGREFESNIPYQNVSDAVPVFINDTLLVSPGSAYNYTTYGWTLISAVMEQSVHSPFLNIMDMELIQPLQLKHLAADQKSKDLHRPVFYYYFNDTLRICEDADLSNKWAGGGYLGSSEDVAKVGSKILDPFYFPADILNEFTTTQMTMTGDTTNYGVGFAVGIENDHRWFGHAGGSVGGSSMMLIYPEEELVVVTLTNLSGAQFDRLAWRLAEHIIAQPK